MTFAVLAGIAGLLIGILGILLMNRGFRSLQKPGAWEVKHLDISSIVAASNRVNAEAHAFVDAQEQVLDIPPRRWTPQRKRRPTRPPRTLVEVIQGALGPSPTIARRRNVELPSWAFAFMATEDAQRYAREWGAHLKQLVEEGEIRQARRDRRRLALAAITLAVALRVRTVLRKAR